ncbi:MAG: hypothetical protein AAF251_11705 [Pseudomonadota bacterium]
MPVSLGVIVTLEEIYYIGQTIAVVAILGSLGAIWVQMRKDHALARAEREQELMGGLNTLYDYLANDKEAVDSIRACFQDYDGAPYDQQVKFGYLVHRGVNLAQQAYYLRRGNLYDPVLYESAFGLALMYLNTPGGRQHWRTIRLVYDDHIRTALDEALAASQEGPKIWDIYPFFAGDLESLSDAGRPSKAPVQGEVE